MSETTPIAVRLADYIVSATSFPASVTQRARLAILDTVGCMVAATRTRAGRLIGEHAASRRAPGRSSIVGRPEPVAAEDAALANATLAHMLEMDDGHRPSDNHLGCVVVPTALAEAEHVGATMGTCLDAIIIGYDVMGRVGESTCLPRKRNHFQGTGTTGVFGAAAIAARLHGLSAHETAHALAIAGTAAAGLRESAKNGPDCKPLQAGRAAQHGISSADLAASGYQGPLTIFEGRHGFCAATSGEPRPELICRDLGERFAIEESGIKVHASCGTLFGVLDGIIDLRRDHGLQTVSADAIRVSIPSWQLDDEAFSRRRPRTAGEAHFSIPFAAAAAMVEGEFSLRQMTDEKLASVAIAEVEDLVELVPDAEVDRIYEATKADPFFYQPAAVEIDHDGRTYRSLNRSPRGYDVANRPLTTDEVLAKFRSAVAHVLSTDAAGQLAEIVLDVGDDRPVDGLAALLRFDSGIS